MGRPKGIDWDAVDWGDGTKDIVRAHEFGVAESVVAGARRRRGYLRTRRKGIDWDRVDLSRSTIVIARELGVHAASVEHARRARGITEYVDGRRRPGRTA